MEPQSKRSLQAGQTAGPPAGDRNFGAACSASAGVLCSAMGSSQKQRLGRFCKWPRSTASPSNSKRRHQIHWQLALVAFLSALVLLPRGAVSTNQPIAGVARQSAQIAASDDPHQQRRVQGQVSEVQSGQPSGELTPEHLQRVIDAMQKAEAQGTIYAPLGNWGKQQGIKAADNSDSNMMRLVDCINRQHVAKNMTWASAMSDDLASTKVAGAWWSTKQRRVPMTVVTQSTVDRIPQLYSQCKSWHGPVSVVLYIALVQDSLDKLTPENENNLRTAVMQVSGFFEDVERDPEACMPDIMLVYELYTERQATMLYPINLLRNLARLQARTPMLALVDADMLLSRHLYTELLVPAVQQQMLQATQAKSVYVLPAFETYGETHEAAALADVLVSQDKVSPKGDCLVRDKDLLIRAVDKGIAGPFDSKRFVIGHNSTNFAKWYTSNEDYKITYGERYEPWVVVDRHNVPWHDVRFRGYGNNKIQQIAHINASHFNFIVHHSAFIIHRAHKETIMRQRLVTSKIAFDNAKARNQPVDRSSVYGHTRTLFDNAKELMNQGKFEATLDPATIECHATLPWWRTSTATTKTTNGAARSVRKRRERASRALKRGKARAATRRLMWA